MEAVFKAVAIDRVLHSDPELEAQGNTTPTCSNRYLASEGTGLPAYES